MRSIARTQVALAALALAGLVACVRDAGEQDLISKTQEKATSMLVMSALAASDPPQASVWVYMCPDFNMGCSSVAFKVGSTCLPAASAITPGACFDTGVAIPPGLDSSVASCTDTSCTSCGTTVTFDTPASFLLPQYWPGVYFFCSTPCDGSLPPTCPPGE